MPWSRIEVALPQAWNSLPSHRGRPCWMSAVERAHWPAQSESQSESARPSQPEAEILNTWNMELERKSIMIDSTRSVMTPTRPQKGVRPKHWRPGAAAPAARAAATAWLGVTPSRAGAGPAPTARPGPAGPHSTRPGPASRPCPASVYVI